MHPVLLSFGPAEAPTVISTYGAAFWAAAAVAVAVAFLGARRLGLPARSLAIVIAAAALAVPVGGRALHVLEYPSLYSGPDAYGVLTLSATRFSLMGGVVLAAVTGLAASRTLRIDTWKLADAAAPALALGIAVMRVGCFCGGCCFGTVTSGATGVAFPPGSPAHLYHLALGRVGFLSESLPVHPTQLYELTAALLVGAVAVALTARRLPSGAPFLVAAALFAAARWALYPLRVQPDSLVDPAWFYPALYASLIALCALLARWRFAAVRAVDGPALGAHHAEARILR